VDSYNHDRERVFLLRSLRVPKRTGRALPGTLMIYGYLSDYDLVMSMSRVRLVSVIIDGSCITLDMFYIFQRNDLGR